MSTSEKAVLSASVEINAPIEKVWELWTVPEHIMAWNNFSDDWHNLKVENDPQSGGKFLFAMALKDGSFGFDFAGVYDEVIPHQVITYTVDGVQKVAVADGFTMVAWPTKPRHAKVVILGLDGPPAKK